MNLPILTHSSSSMFRTCRAKYDMRYNIGLSRVHRSPALFFGSLMHDCLDRMRKGLPSPEVDIKTEGDMLAVGQVSKLVQGYRAYWDSQTTPWTKVVATVKSEEAFSLRIPGVKGMRFCGKIDAIVTVADGRTALLETKTAGDSIDGDSDYWDRVMVDQQVTGYCWAASQIGVPVATVLYDVIRKPTIRVKQTEDVASYCQRLEEDIASRPEFYYQRREIPRSQRDLDVFEAELVHTARDMRDARKMKRWYRNTSACTQFGRCEYLDICARGGFTGEVPDGWQIVDDKHPELTQ